MVESINVIIENILYKRLYTYAHVHVHVHANHRPPPVGPYSIIPSTERIENSIYMYMYNTEYDDL